MSRKPSHTVETNADNAMTWVFVGLLLVAAVAGLFGQAGIH